MSKLEIMTRTDGREDSFRTGCRVERDACGISVFYCQDGDETLLRICPRELTMDRASRLSLRFVPNAESGGKIFFGTLHADVSVFTSEYIFRDGADGVTILLRYVLHFPHEDKEYFLRIRLDGIGGGL